MALDVSKDSTVLFVGGSSDFYFESGSACLQAVSFNPSLSFISDLRIDERQNKYISKIKRIEETNKFFAATVDIIYVYEFKNRKFYKLSAIQNIGSRTDSITDMVIVKNILYTFVSGDTVINKIEFASY